MAQDGKQVPGESGVVQMKRKERMCWYIERICSILQHLPDTQANEIECKALWANLSLSHTDISEKLNTKPTKEVIAMACGGKKTGGKKPTKKK